MFQSLMILTKKEYFDFVCILYGYLVNTAADEGLFLSTRRLKTWHRSRMGDDRFSNLAVSVTSGDQTVSL